MPVAQSKHFDRPERAAARWQTRPTRSECWRLRRAELGCDQIRTRRLACHRRARPCGSGSRPLTPKELTTSCKPLRGAVARDRNPKGSSFQISDAVVSPEPSGEPETSEASGGAKHPVFPAVFAAGSEEDASRERRQRRRGRQRGDAAGCGMGRGTRRQQRGEKKSGERSPTPLAHGTSLLHCI
eukprot:scaffold3978_cov291-Pinguiococcus_pyrenoidosus.AAC.19